MFLSILSVGINNSYIFKDKRVKRNKKIIIFIVIHPKILQTLFITIPSFF